jgi:hypothetical protein
MRRVGTLSAGLSVLCALLAIAACSASAAQPTWWACMKAEPKNTGHYADRACSSAVESGGKYELRPGVGKAKPFKSERPGGQSVMHVVIPGLGELKVECGELKVKGRAAAPNLERGVTFSFSKCKALGGPCSSFTTSPLAGELGWLNKEEGVVGIELANEISPGSGFIAQFECPGLAKVRVHGSFIGTQHDDVGGLSSASRMLYTVGAYFGELSPPGYSPIVNRPSFEEGPTGVLLTELNDAENHNTWGPEGGLPSGLEAYGGDGQNRGIVLKGETLMIQ